MRFALWSIPFALFASVASAVDFDIAPGKYKPAWESLESQYQCPEWFRDAKFGIWAHWGPQCQPEQGDWYARALYQFNAGQYKYQCEHYGHPSKAGFKEVIHEWKADKFDPERLIALYKKAGAKYFVSMANHHCNFDNFNSKYQPWNSVAVGPHQDLVGKWAAAARKAGLRFGVTVHAARSWTWYEVAQGSDPSGPLAGVPYDGKLTKADGKGLWWEGLDPQDLYAQNHAIGAKPDAAYCEKFYKRTKQLIDDYKPDLLYFDDRVLPLANVDPAYGLNIAAHLYNASVQQHGDNEAVMNTKFLNEEQRKGMVWDIERGKSGRVEQYPWQTDTCIGGWHYSRAIYNDHGYKTPTKVVQMLIDIVSKNGNLLLNIPVRGDGTIDELEEKCLEGIADWMAINGEGIFGTRPWKSYGEGVREGRGGAFNEGRERPYTSADFRFTTKGDTLYAFALGWPADGKLVVKSLGANEAGIKGDVKSVELLGAGKVDFKREKEGLIVTLPEKKPCEGAWTLKITGLDLAASQPAEHVTIVPYVSKMNKKGQLALLPEDATAHGKKLHFQGRDNRGALVGWDDPADWASWEFELPAAGTYAIGAYISAAKGSAEIEAEISGQTLVAKAPESDSWNDYHVLPLGRVTLDKGKYTLKVRAHDAAKWKPVNLGPVLVTKKDK